MYVPVCICKYVCMYAFVYVHTDVYVAIYICVCVLRHLCDLFKNLIVDHISLTQSMTDADVLQIPIIVTMS